MLTRAEERGKQTFEVARRLVGGLVVASLFSVSAFADGLDYLATQQSVTGSFGNTPKQSGSMVRDCFVAYGSSQ